MAAPSLPGRPGLLLKPSPRWRSQQLRKKESLATIPAPASRLQPLLAASKHQDMSRLLSHTSLQAAISSFFVIEFFAGSDSKYKDRDPDSAPTNNTPPKILGPELRAVQNHRELANETEFPVNDMIKHPKKVNFEANNTGSCSSATIGSFINMRFIGNSYHHRKEDNKTAALVHDPDRLGLEMVLLRARLPGPNDDHLDRDGDDDEYNHRDGVDTTTQVVATVTTRPTWTIEKFSVTTIKPKKRWDPDGNALEARATTTTSVCPSAAQTNACSCLYPCAGPVTKDSRKTQKVLETETSYYITTNYVTVTYDEYDARPTTETTPYTWTTTKAVLATHTRTIKCTPLISNPSFYLSATISPIPTTTPSLPFIAKYVRVEPTFDWISEIFIPQYTRYKSDATLFTLDSKGRLVTPTTYGDRFSGTDDFNSFEPFYFLSRNFVQNRSPYWPYIVCELLEPSGRFAGGYKELNCHGTGFWPLKVFQFCPEYLRYYPFGTILGTELSDTSPDCFQVTYLVVPACG
ncbi:hypothetical protein B0T19DRAFT_476420 [Cercophora scortea]|uniref:Uncharacterized protein n=1 Tax=Cercophora scortea TaxID=314031 RepID=A0AAE0M9W6_9PEZI|nr:hypothetical protein B0T19DRAFT_476420 [Cercophora scortea]